MIGVVTNIYRYGDPRRPEGNPAIPVLYVTVPGDRAHPNPEQRATPDLVATFSGDPPPPLSVCTFTDDKTPHCLGSVAASIEPILRDHFTIVAADDGDTPWDTVISATGGVGAAGGTQIPGVGLGVTRVQSNNVVGASTVNAKHPQMLRLASADALWVRCRFQLGQSAASLYAAWGLRLSASSVDDQASCVFNTADATDATNWRLVTQKDGLPAAANRVSTATPGAVDGFHYGDLLLVPGEFASLWIDGDGPYSVTTTTDVPASTDSVTPYWQVFTHTAASKNFDLDLIWVDAINGALAHPITHELLTL